jgi:hypothetical protein
LAERETQDQALSEDIQDNSKNDNPTQEQIWENNMANNIAADTMSKIELAIKCYQQYPSFPETPSKRERDELLTRSLGMLPQLGIL